MELNKIRLRFGPSDGSESRFVGVGGRGSYVQRLLLAKRTEGEGGESYLKSSHIPKPNSKNITQNKQTQKKKHQKLL